MWQCSAISKRNAWSSAHTMPFARERAQNEIINCVCNKRMVKFNFVRSALCTSLVWARLGVRVEEFLFFIKLSPELRQIMAGGTEAIHMRCGDRHNKTCVSAAGQTLFLSCYAPDLFSPPLQSFFSPLIALDNLTFALSFIKMKRALFCSLRFPYSTLAA